MPDNKKKPERVETVFAFILVETKAERIKLYRNILKMPYILCNHEKYYKLHAYLFDDDVRNWFSHFVKEEVGFLLKIREINCILAELAGRSMSELVDKIQDPFLTRMIESEPVVAAVLEFTHIMPTDPYEVTMEVLWKELLKFAKNRGMLVLGKNRFPGGANVLSRKLTEFLKVFEQLGITIVILRSNGSKVTISRRLDDSSPKPSVESSELNSNYNNGLSLMDDKSKNILHLQQRKKEIERSSNEQSES